MIAFLGISLASCSSDNTVAENAESAVNHYSPEGTSYISVSPEQEATSRSALQDAESYLNFQWNAGDQLIVVEPTAGVIGTLTTVMGSQMSTSGGRVLATFSGSVKGTLADGDKLHFYYLGNKNLDLGTKTLDCDYSIQGGTLTSANSLRYLATGEVEMKKNAATGNFEPSSSLSLASKISILKFKLTYTDDASQTYNASSCTINGLYNKASINLCSGGFTSGYVKNVYDQSEDIKSIAMSHSRSGSSPYYYVAVPVFESKTFDNPNMRCTFFDANSTTLTQSWTSWSIGQGGWYAGDDGKGMALELTNYTTKGGYGGCDILGGTNNTDYSTKGGYSGNPVDGQVDDPEVTKGGYNGNDVQ